MSVSLRSIVIILVSTASLSDAGNAAAELGTLDRAFVAEVRGEDRVSPEQWFMHALEKHQRARNPYDSPWYGGILRAMKERDVRRRAMSGVEIYRLLIVRAFRNPYMARIEKRGTGISLVFKSASWSAGKKIGGWGTGSIGLVRHATVSVVDWGRFKQLLARARFWRIPSRSSSAGFDGSQWILEGAVDGRYHYVDRWVGGEKPFRDACQFLLDLVPDK